MENTKVNKPPFALNIQEILSELYTHADNGLTSGAAKERLLTYGANSFS